MSQHAPFSISFSVHCFVTTNKIKADCIVPNDDMLTVYSKNSASVSRRSSRAAAATRSRHSSITSALFRQQCSGPRQSTDTAASFGGASSGARPSSRLHFVAGNYDVPGIEISRTDTLDFDDGSLLATCSGKHGYGSGSKPSYILLNGYIVLLHFFCEKFYRCIVR